MISIGVPQLKDPINILTFVIFSKAISGPINQIQKSKAIVNTKNKDLEPRLSKYIVKASDEVIKGKLDKHFP